MSHILVFQKGRFSEYSYNFFNDLGVSFRLLVYIRKKQEPQSLKLNHSFLDAR